MAIRGPASKTRSIGVLGLVYFAKFDFWSVPFFGCPPCWGAFQGGTTEKPPSFGVAKLQLLRGDLLPAAERHGLRALPGWTSAELTSVGDENVKLTSAQLSITGTYMT